VSTSDGRPQQPWWASGRDPDEGIDDQDPFDAHRDARSGRSDPPSGDRGDPPPRWIEDAVDLIARFATEANRRFAPRSGQSASDDDVGAGFTAHVGGEVCDACPVCIGLRAIRSSRPDVITHLSEAAHHLSLALKAFADAQADATTDTFEHIDLDLE
jgi:hypothetical protein